MALVVVCVVGLVFACVLTVRARGAERPPPIEFVDATGWARLGPVIRRASALAAAGLVAGVLVLGLGSRLMMRVAAAASPASAQGRLTDAEEVVGRVTLGGTVALVMFVGLSAALLTSVVWVLMRRWLPHRSATAGAVVAAIGGGLLARPSGLIDPDNHDFVILSPVWLALLLSMLTLLGYGLCFAVLADRWAVTWPAPAVSVRGVAGVLPFVAVFAVSALVVVPAIVIVVAVACAAWVPRGAGQRPRLERTERPGRLAFGCLAVLGAGWVGVSAVQVLTV